MNKPELYISAGSVAEAQRYIEAGVDAVAVGEHRYGMRLPGQVMVDDLRTFIPRAHACGAKVYVVVNKILDNDLLPVLPDYLREIHQLGADAVVFGDPAVLVAIRQAAPGMPLHWNAEMTSTNYETARYWASQGAVRVVLARELNMDETIEIKQNLPDMEVQVQVHGITNIYHSKRDLVSNYEAHQSRGGLQAGKGLEDGLFLIEQERKDERYPVYEDVNGTHIMSSDDVCMLENLHELMEGRIDSLRIEPLLKSVEYNETVIKAYRAAIDAYTADPANYEFQEQWLEAIREIQDPRRELSFGFFYKEQVY
ncbi:peptidase U32 family protein [Paenibacillus xerothermodurans]|uniref:U32 family peptidase n=1 Tax=Paenibacillus xerothermodurans TaxID=1977292 RepID=A0A2W1N8H7_PAEXE|nr:peptidase U32 family protein [Paenibacillus xerothermodurans]PZE19481.1 U32 family peptidase [Paenibacillus xerothermodurans]